MYINSCLTEYFIDLMFRLNVNTSAKKEDEVGRTKKRSL